MHAPLKTRLWKEIDAALHAALSCKPAKRSAVWRLYKLQGSMPQAFVTAEYFDTAGGKFSFAFGASRGSFPTQTDAPVRQLSTTIPFALVYGEAIGVPHAQVSVELDWQSPSASLVKVALLLPPAQPVLAGLGVTADANHHMLSYGILEALGVTVPAEEFEHVVLKFNERLQHTIAASILPGVRQLGELVASGT